MQTNQANDARIDLFIGSTGTGKSTSIKALLAEERPARVLVWDFMHEDGYAKIGRPAESGAALLKALDAPGARVAFRPDHDKPIDPQFALFCRAAFAYGDCTLIAEELSAVTKPNWAPDAWKKCLVMGRHRGMHVIGATQRPALVDKTIFSQATRIRCGRLLYDDDCKTMAKVLKADPGEIGEMPDGAFIERFMRTGETVRGAISLRKGNRSAKKPAT
ncbi:hypothetical protein BGV68_01885 [Burkholderia ubonensis]|uniref:hypothetical protein n=1 Tax=Burkholderia ubonensis TaxID=101571 RepID=UPI0008FDAE6E|nr:hypothetical protein [Burkholderia ubonensis]OJA63796.1 hypothetical protein BGV68_01885 [Burkholderia ubonensis]